jgi:zinc transporter 1/2/3
MVPHGTCAAVQQKDGSLLTLRLVGLFTILAASLLGVLLPLSSAASRQPLLFFMARVAGAGVVLATGFVHVLPDANAALTNPCLGFSSNYPWAFVFAAFSSQTTFVISLILRSWLRKQRVKSHTTVSGCAGAVSVELTNAAAAAATHSETLPKTCRPEDTAEATTPGPDASGPVQLGCLGLKPADAKVLDYRMVAYILEAGTVFHSIFVGLPLGAGHDKATVRALVVALVFHQGFEGIALGSVFVKAKFSMRKYALLATIFSCITPLGVAIGMMLSSYNSNSRISLGFEGSFSSVSAGILIYNGLVDLLAPAFDPEEMPANRCAAPLGVLSLFAGCAAMSVVGKWA